jgi:hypothetical protein
VRDHAIALGLLNLPSRGTEPELTNRAFARLLLAGYGLPAHVHVGTVGSLQTALREDHLVFVLVQEKLADPPTSPEGWTVLQVHALLVNRNEESGMLFSDPGASPRSWRRLPRDFFHAAWEAPGNLQLSVARAWSDLPTAGPSFFGGSCNADGTYFWETAECDTDRDGRVMRF